MGWKGKSLRVRLRSRGEEQVYIVVIVCEYKNCR